MKNKGFTLIELLVSMTIMLLVIGGIFSMVDPGRGISKTQPEVADMQERMRIAADQLEKDLLMAGAGTYSGAGLGALANFFPPILPRRIGKKYENVDSDVLFYDDRITIAYVPDTAAQTTVAWPMPQPSSEIRTTYQPGCPLDVNPLDALCGFKEGMRVLIFDATGAYDFFTITEVQSTGSGSTSDPATGHLQHNPTMNANADLSKAYQVGAQIALVETHVYWQNQPSAQLFHYDGSINTDGTFPDYPFVDNAVQLRFTYFGDPNPPLLPRPAAGSSNCIIDVAGNPTLPLLPSTSSSLVQLTKAQLEDGPWCGVAPNRFDADLYRVRKIRVELRVQAGLSELRGKNPTGQTLFVNPGNSTSAYQRVPDYSMSFEVAPRNMNLAR
jgi:prepilin-type N-terminal cleavage/methylation domain-containing protein